MCGLFAKVVRYIDGETLCGQWTACSAHLAMESQVVTSGWPLAVGQLRYGKNIALQSFEAEVAMFLHKEARRVKYFKFLQARNPNDPKPERLFR